MSNTHNISAVIIACNEEKYIGSCIQSIKEITEDIIVIDSGSTDNTVKIAELLSARVYSKNWEGYGANKNYGISHAKYDWILAIDADEVLDKKLIDTILSLNKDKRHIYQLNSLVNFAGTWVRHCGWYPRWKNRLFNKNVTSWNLDSVHEELIFPSHQIFKKLDGTILHYSYDSISDHREKTKKYGKLKGKEWFEKGKKIGYLKRLTGPAFRFFRTYIIKLGILDGRTGYIISKANSEMIKIAVAEYDQLKSS